MATIPGTPAKHAVITDSCRANRSDRRAFEEAVERLRAEYEACMKGHPFGHGTQFHLVLTVERAMSVPCAARTPHDAHPWTAQLGEPDRASRTCRVVMCPGIKHVSLDSGGDE